MSQWLSKCGTMSYKLMDSSHAKPQVSFAVHVLLQIFSKIRPPKIDKGHNTSIISKELSSVILIKVVPLIPAHPLLKIYAQIIYF